MTTKSTKSTKAAAGSSKSLADFRATYDKNYVVPKKIEEGLKKLGKKGWQYEVEFIRTCGISTTDLATFRDQFEEYYVNVGGRNPKRVWGGSKELVEEMKLGS